MGVSGRKSSTIRVAVRRLRVWPSDHHTPRKPTPRRSSQTRECTAACSSMLEKTQLSVLATFCLSARFLRVRWFRTLRRRLVTVVLWAEPLVTMSPLLDTTRTRARRESSFPVVPSTYWQGFNHFQICCPRSKGWSYCCQKNWSAPWYPEDQGIDVTIAWVWKTASL